MPRRDTTPTEERWLKRFDRVCKDKPRTLKVFVASGSVCVLLAAPDGSMPHGNASGDPEGVDQREVVHQVDGAKGWDGGDW